LLLGIILFLFARVRTFDKPYLLVATYSESSAEEQIYAIMKESARRHNLKSKTVSPGSVEITLEVRIRENDSGFVNRIAGLQGVTSAVLVSYNGDYAT
jgi:hypothetical protein